MTKIRHLLRCALCVLYLAACSGDASTTLTGPIPSDPLFAGEDPKEGCGDLDPDPICEPGGEDAGYEEYVGDVDGDGGFEVSMSPLHDANFSSAAEASTGQPVQCLAGLSQAGVTATIRRTTEPNLVIVSSGWWGIIFDALPPPYGRYMWPVGPGGWWPALDPSDKRKGYIEQGDCHCWLEKRRPDLWVIHHDFYRYYGTRIWHPPASSGGGGGGGGDGGGDGDGGPSAGGGCVDEYVEVWASVNNGEEKLIWSGWVRKCA